MSPLPPDPKPPIHEGKKTIASAISQLAGVLWLYYEVPDLPTGGLVFAIAACAATVVSRIVAKVEL